MGTLRRLRHDSRLRREDSTNFGWGGLHEHDDDLATSAKNYCGHHIGVGPTTWRLAGGNFWSSRAISRRATSATFSGRWPIDDPRAAVRSMLHLPTRHPSRSFDMRNHRRSFSFCLTEALRVLGLFSGFGQVEYGALGCLFVVVQVFLRVRSKFGASEGQRGAVCRRDAIRLPRPLHGCAAIRTKVGEQPSERYAVHAIMRQHFPELRGEAGRSGGTATQTTLRICVFDPEDARSKPAAFEGPARCKHAI